MPQRATGTAILWRRSGVKLGVISKDDFRVLAPATSTSLAPLISARSSGEIGRRDESTLIGRAPTSLSAESRMKPSPTLTFFARLGSTREGEQTTKSFC